MIKYYRDKSGEYRYVLDVKRYLEWSVTNIMATHDLHPIQHDTYAHFKKSLLKFDKKANRWYKSSDRYINMYQTYRLSDVSDTEVIDFLNDKKCILIGTDDE